MNNTKVTLPKTYISRKDGKHHFYGQEIIINISCANCQGFLGNDFFESSKRPCHAACYCQPCDEVYFDCESCESTKVIEIITTRNKILHCFLCKKDKKVKD